MPCARAPATSRASRLASSIVWSRDRTNSSQARCQTSSMRRAIANGSRARASTGGVSSISATRASKARAASPWHVLTRAHEFVSRFHTPAGGSRSAIVPRWTRPMVDLPRADRPGPRSYRDRSSIFSIGVEVLHEVAHLHYRVARWRPRADACWRRHPALPHCLGQERIGKESTTARLRRTELRHNAVPVGHQHDLAAGSYANVLAKLVLEDFEPD